MKTLFGNNLTWRTIDVNELSPYFPGYIFTPTGEVIGVSDDEDHSSVFSEYYSKYLELDETEVMDVFKASQKLCELKHSIYLGFKLNEINKSMISNNGINNLLVPNEIENIPDKEKASLIKLLECGHSKSMVININTFDNQFYIEEDFLNILKSNNQQKK